MLRTQELNWEMVWSESKGEKLCAEMRGREGGGACLDSTGNLGHVN